MAKQPAGNGPAIAAAEATADGAVSATTTISRAHKIKLKPNRAQEEYFRRACGARRFIFNWTLEQWNEQYRLHKENPEIHPRPKWMELRKLMTQMKKDPDFAWLNEICANVTERAVADVGKAWDNYFRAIKHGDSSFRRPRFTGKGKRERFYVHTQKLRFSDDGKRVRLSKVPGGWVRCREPLRFEGKIMSGTVSRAADGWYLSVQVDVPHVNKPHPSPGSVGIDMGVANQLALSDGRLFQLPMQRIEKLHRQLRRQQKNLSRKWSGKIKKGHADKAILDEEGHCKRKSNRFMKQSQRVARLHQRIANIRLDGLHNLSRLIVDQHEAIAIENLQIKNMTASAKGTVEAPGRNVRAKSGLNRSMLNAALRQLRILLEYKADAAGGVVVAVDPAYTSQTCSNCGHIDKQNRPSQEKFLCVSCGYSEHADVNAARNILAKMENGL